MPVGVPKVPFEGPDDEEAIWVDLYNRLYRQRAIFLGQKLDSPLANQILGLLVYLNIQDSFKDMFLFINSPGGSILSGIAIYDMIQIVEPDVQTFCIGLAASMASFILLGGEITKRTAFPHARVMMHQPISDLCPKITTGVYFEDIQEVSKLYYTVLNCYQQRTGKPFWVIYEDMRRDTFMSAEEAQSHGIIDVIAGER
uniref:ATP-dependent Clp protease proteolytic subunit n=1 Tax=Acacia puncticulata TaxID=1708236 RepID=A0A1D0CF29_9FABA|nr:clpP1 [Acacia puncticulata]